MTTPRSERPLQSLIDDVKALPFDVLFPVRRWMGDRPWRMRWVQALLFFALFPLSLSHLWGPDAEIRDAAWAIGTYFALLWGYVLWALVQPGSLKRRNLGTAIAFTSVVGILLVLVLQRLPFISVLYSATDWSFSPARLVGFVAGVGVVEEAVKLLPVFWLAVKLREIRTPREAAFYAGISGLAFGVAEAVTYSIDYTDLNTVGMVYGLVGSGNYVISEFLRLITLPFLHCVFSGIAGYYLGLSLLAPQRRAALVVLGVGLAAVIHGLYDFFAGTWLGIGVGALAILMFVAYLRSAEHITQHITGQDERPRPTVSLRRPPHDEWTFNLFRCLVRADAHGRWPAQNSGAWHPRSPGLRRVRPPPHVRVPDGLSQRLGLRHRHERAGSVGLEDRELPPGDIRRRLLHDRQLRVHHVPPQVGLVTISR